MNDNDTNQNHSYHDSTYFGLISQLPPNLPKLPIKPTLPIPQTPKPLSSRPKFTINSTKSIFLLAALALPTRNRPKLQGILHNLIINSTSLKSGLSK
jgi:hypothetical protein